MNKCVICNKQHRKNKKGQVEESYVSNVGKLGRLRFHIGCVVSHAKFKAPPRGKNIDTYSPKDIIDFLENLEVLKVYKGLTI